MLIVDPTDQSVALIDGELAWAVRCTRIANPAAPTVAELRASGAIIGYSPALLP